MRSALILSVVLALLVSGLAQSNLQSTGGDYGRSWLSTHGNKFPASDNKNSLWDWGGSPMGYERLNGTIRPVLAPTQVIYPDFMTNSTPVVVNGTSMINYVPYDLYSPSFTSDPWMMAQMLGRPVVVVYPAGTKSSVLG